MRIIEKAAYERDLSTLLEKRSENKSDERIKVIFIKVFRDPPGIGGDGGGGWSGGGTGGW
ncbi:MAG: hypothetical protein K1060chlam3_00262 [Candidatus Anoxychlamydiales bacterium]|nr:hypothetical protein [Candidatus Anoxychlamydiales bacterium]